MNEITKLNQCTKVIAFITDGVPSGVWLLLASNSRCRGLTREDGFRIVQMNYSCAQYRGSNGLRFWWVGLLLVPQASRLNCNCSGCGLVERLDTRLNA
jgi:hypothetical protein